MSASQQLARDEIKEKQEELHLLKLIQTTRLRRAAIRHVLAKVSLDHHVLQTVS